MAESAPTLLDLAESVRQADEDRFLAAALAPPDARAALFAVYAAAHEIAKTAETVREPHIGAIRFAWWREAVEEVRAGAAVRAHPMVEALQRAHRARPLPLQAFDAMIDARAADLEAAPFATWAEIEAYLEKTAGSVLGLACAAC
ncbi:MAG: squalene/phytoene synthase family protein, partial [Hyphomonadaceae bacterium]